MAELPIDHAIDPAVFARSVSTMRTLAAVLPRLERAPGDVPDLLALAPELVCELGFDRSLVSRVADGIWYPEPIYLVGDPAWIAGIAAARATAPIPFAPGKPETTMVSASRTRRYIAAPILSGEEVVGVLTADRYRSRRTVDEFDRDLLAVFAVVFQLALTRAALAKRVHSTEDLLGKVSRACRAQGSQIRRTPPIRIERGSGDISSSLGARSRPRAPRRLPDSLTPRELEVLGQLAGGRTNLAIAHALYISEGTVKQHVKHVLRKLGVNNRSEAVMRWFQAGELTDQLDDRIS